MELYGLVSVIDEHFFGDEDSFRAAYLSTGAAGNRLLFLRKRLERSASARCAARFNKRA